MWKSLTRAICPCHSILSLSSSFQFPQSFYIVYLKTYYFLDAASQAGPQIGDSEVIESWWVFRAVCWGNKGNDAWEENECLKILENPLGPSWMKSVLHLSKLSVSHTTVLDSVHLSLLLFYISFCSTCCLLLLALLDLDLSLPPSFSFYQHWVWEIV